MSPNRGKAAVIISVAYALAMMCLVRPLSFLHTAGQSLTAEALRAAIIGFAAALGAWLSIRKVEPSVPWCLLGGAVGGLFAGAAAFALAAIPEATDSSFDSTMAFLGGVAGAFIGLMVGGVAGVIFTWIARVALRRTTAEAYSLDAVEGAMVTAAKVLVPFGLIAGGIHAAFAIVDYVALTALTMSALFLVIASKLDRDRAAWLTATQQGTKPGFTIVPTGPFNLPAFMAGAGSDSVIAQLPPPTETPFRAAPPAPMPIAYFDAQTSTLAQKRAVRYASFSVVVVILGALVVVGRSLMNHSAPVYSSNPMLVLRNEPITSIAASEDYVCAHSISKGALWCWGSNVGWLLGSSQQVYKHPQKASAQLGTIKKLALESDRACAIDDQQKTVCWSAKDRVPKPYGPPNATEIMLASSFSVLLTTDGSVWLSKDGGEPTQAKELPPIRKLQAGRYHAVAHAKDGSVWCWGGLSGDACGPKKSEAEFQRFDELYDDIEVTPYSTRLRKGRSIAQTYGFEGQRLLELKHDANTERIVYAGGMTCQYGSSAGDVRCANGATYPSQKIARGARDVVAASRLGFCARTDSEVWCWKE